MLTAGLMVNGKRPMWEEQTRWENHFNNDTNSLDYARFQPSEALCPHIFACTKGAVNNIFKRPFRAHLRRNRPRRLASQNGP